MTGLYFGSDRGCGRSCIWTVNVLSALANLAAAICALFLPDADECGSDAAYAWVVAVVVLGFFFGFCHAGLTVLNALSTFKASWENRCRGANRAVLGGSFVCALALFIWGVTCRLALESADDCDQSSLYVRYMDVVVWLLFASFLGLLPILFCLVWSCIENQ